MAMNTYLPALAKDFAPDANVWRKKYHVFRFFSCSVLQQKEKLLNSLYICRGVFRAQSNIYDGTFFCKFSKQLKTVNHFFKKDPSQIFDWVQNRPPIWIYLIIFRTASSACIYLNILCVIVCQKIMEHKPLTTIVL